MLKLSVIMPVLDEADGIAAALAALAPLRDAGTELIVVDGGSTDGTPALARPLADRLLAAPRGRASQMNAGAAAARGDVLLFLHADTRLPPDAGRLVGREIDRGRPWGRFDVRIEGHSPLLRIVARAMNLRSRWSGIATGDQAIFATRSAFESVGGFPDIPLMEDIVFSRRMLRISRPACIPDRATTSGRRWERHGVLRTILTMWWLRLRFFLGAHPAELARRYGCHPRER